MVRTADGLSMTAEWWDLTTPGGGYSPVEVTITNATSRQRTVRVAVESQVRGSGNDVSKTVELAPTGSATITLSVPLTSAYWSGILKLYERGNEKKTARIYGVGGNMWWGGQIVPTIMFIGRSTPDMRLLSEASNKITTGQPAAGNMQTALAVKPERVPEKWIDFTMLDLVVISLREFEQLPPVKRDSLVAWALAGGNFFIYGLGDDAENSLDLKRLLDLDRRPPQKAEWRTPRKEDRNTDMAVGNTQVPTNRVIVRNMGGNKVATTVTPALPVPAGGTGQPPVASSATEDISAHFRIRSFGLGQLIACSSADPFPGTPDDWGWVLKSLGTNRLNWVERHGVSARGQNDDFWNFLIPGVGRAPVGGFQVLITLFALVIGPVNYFLLQRRKQLYLLILTVPLFAIATTVLLLGYAVASDGFALRGRARSVTMLDQVHGESVSWSRLSYYAGVAPSGGLRFSPDTAVYPIDPPGDPSGGRSLDWTTLQHMPSGWLRSRTPTQLLTVAYRQGPEQLTVASGSGEAVRVTNNLGTHIHKLLLLDEEGNTYGAEDLARDVSVRLEPKEFADLHAGLRKILATQPLEIPPEITDRYMAVGGMGSRRYWNRQVQPAQWNTSVSEGFLQVLADVNPDGLKALLRPRTYVAITERPPHVDLGVTRMEDNGSVFVIWGMY